MSVIFICNGTILFMNIGVIHFDILSGQFFLGCIFCSLMALSDSEDDYCYLIFNLVKVTLLLILFLFGPLLCLYANKLIGFQAFNLRVKPTFFFQTSIPPSQVIVFIVYVHSRCWKSVCLVWFLTIFSYYFRRTDSFR